MENEIKLFGEHGRAKDECTLLNWIQLFLAGFFKEDIQYFGAARGEERLTDLRSFLNPVIPIGFSLLVSGPKLLSL